jgi:hypothetical protein
MPKKRRSGIDRRSGEDRRKVYSLDYFANGGIERRSMWERRSRGERRLRWVRVNEWASVFIGDSKAQKM